MQALMLFCITVATLSEYAALKWALPTWFKFIPDMLSCMIAVATVLLAVRKGFTLVAAKYWIAFTLAVIVIICGAFSNSEGAGPILMGMRYYLRPIPLFLFPAMVRFTERQLQQQLRLVLALGFLQIPFAIYQRYVVLSEGRYTGDEVVGTLVESGVLSIALLCIVLVLTGFFLHRRIEKKYFFSAFLLLLIPTTINETKATVVLLPVGLLTAVLLAAPPKRRLRIFALGVALLAVFGAILVPIYDAMEQHNPYKNEKHLMDFFTNERNFDKYMSSKGAGIGATTGIRRGDAIRIPVEYMSRDPVRLAFGLGIGNASHSSLGENYSGDYYKLFEKVGVTSFSVFLLEIGILGSGAVFLLYWFVFTDAMAVSKSDTTTVGALAAGWTGVVPMMGLATFYITTHMFASLTYLYWYFSGVVAARRSELAIEARETRISAPTGRPPSTVAHGSAAQGHPPAGTQARDSRI